MFYRHLKVSVARRQRREPPARREPLWRLASGDMSRYAVAAHRTEHDAAGKMHRVGESRTDDAASRKPGAKGTALRGFTGARSGAGESHPQRPSENTGVPGRGGAGIPWCCSSSALDPRGGRADTLALWRCPRLSTLTLGADTSARIHIAPRL